LFSGIVHHQVDRSSSVVGIDNEFVGADTERTCGARFCNDLSRSHRKSTKRDENADHTESKPAGGPVNAGWAVVNFLVFPTTTQESKMAFHGEGTRFLM